MENNLIIIGTGIAGYSVAKEFRKLDQQTALLMITEDAGDYYYKPHLSSALYHKKTAIDIVVAHKEKMADQLHATIISETAVQAIAPIEHTITTSKQIISYSKLVLALGAAPNRLTFNGNAADKILTVNGIREYELFRSKIANKKHVAIIGAGLIGCEFANDLLLAGYDVTIISPTQIPLDRLLNYEAGKILEAQFSKAGAHWYLNSSIAAIDYSTDQYAIRLANGHTILADIVLTATGLSPRTELAKQANININNGIIVDRFLASSCADIYALGDCARIDGLLLQYIAPTLICAKALAKTLTGQPTMINYPAMPIIIKTSLYPIIALPATRPVINTQAQIDNDGISMQVLYYDAQNNLCGFLLTGGMIKNKDALCTQINQVNKYCL